MTGVDWSARLRAQGISEDIISTARETAHAQAARIDGIASDPFTSVDVTGYQALLLKLAKPSKAGPGQGAASGPEGTVEGMAAMLDRGALTAVDLAMRHFEALATVQDALNAVARLEPEAALAQAQQADRALATAKASGAPRPPLLGIPMAHKDLYARKGWKMEAGSAILRDNVASETATAISALDTAGAVDLGRLNTVEFALGPDGRNPSTGAVRNPWNPDHVTGGSSSGSGSAVGAGLVPVALGSDTGGSIRLPAAACGVVGFKPTAGLIGRRGIWPLAGSLDTAGPLAGTVRDAALVTQALAGYDPDDPQSVPVGVPDLMTDIELGLAGLKVGMAERPFFDPVTPEIADTLDSARKLMQAEGAAVATVEMSGIETANMMNVAIVNAEAATQHRAWLTSRAAEYGPETLGRLIAGLFLPAEAYLSAMNRRAGVLRHVLETTFRQVDVVATPVWPADPPKIDGDNSSAYRSRVEFLGHCARPFNYLGLPAIVLPCGLSKAGLPIALQLVGRPFQEALLLRAARAYERARRFREEHRPMVFAAP